MALAGTSETGNTFSGKGLDNLVKLLFAER